MFIIIGLIIIIIGALMVMKTEVFLSVFGRIEFFDKYLGTEGGTRMGYKIIGLLIIFIGVLVMTNLIGGFIEWVFAPLLRFSQPQQ